MAELGGKKDLWWLGETHTQCVPWGGCVSVLARVKRSIRGQAGEGIIVRGEGEHRGRWGGVIEGRGGGGEQGAGWKGWGG